METDLIVRNASSALRDCSAGAEQLQEHRNTAPGRQCIAKMSMSKPSAAAELQQAQTAVLMEVLLHAAVYAKRRLPQGCRALQQVDSLEM